MRIHTHTIAHTLTHTSASTLTHTLSYTHTDKHTSTDSHTHIHTHTLRYTHTDTHTSTYTLTHIHTHTKAQSLLSRNSPFLFYLLFPFKVLSFVNESRSSSLRQWCNSPAGFSLCIQMRLRSSKWCDSLYFLHPFPRHWIRIGEKLAFSYSTYRECHWFRLTKRDDYFRVTFDHFWSLCRCSWGNKVNWLEYKTKQP